MFDRTSGIEDLRSYMKARSEEKGFTQQAVEKDDFAELRASFPDLKIMGIGGESLALEYPMRPDLVLTLGYCGESRPGVLPFAETYHTHKLLSLLYPGEFAAVHALMGLSTRTAVKEKVVGEMIPKDSQVTKDARAEDIWEELMEANFRIRIDSYYRNYITDGVSTKNIDYVWVFDQDRPFRVDTDKLIAIFDKNNPNLEPKERESMLRQLVTQVTRLRELRLTNIIFQNMIKTGDYSIDRDAIGARLGNSRSQSSVNRVALLLGKATSAVKDDGHHYDLGWKF